MIGTDAFTEKMEMLNWEIPEFEVKNFNKKRNNYALVIPVLNEGKRIRKQLKAISSAGYLIDVIIADGGSNDGSLEASFIRETCVRAVLIKKSSGKLSAQLRMAYSWCLKQGYKGIITMDGNDKDGIEAITLMLDSLNQGFDYIQGSRYVCGGIAENTPLERTIGNRFIHAPILSLSSGFWFTDTTNGFRAYSSYFLLHPSVKPFRNIFTKYELLFYLTVRAGQLKMKITEVPVRRSYPKGLPVPTKINNFSGKLDLFKQTLNASLGLYKP
jgi:glycosyltransferase involved in cell wall biosynthesis